MCGLIMLYAANSKCQIVLILDGHSDDYTNYSLASIYHPSLLDHELVNEYKVNEYKVVS